MKNLSNKEELMNVPEELKRILYKCKKCDWQTSVIAAWGDIKPRMCMNRKCERHRTNAFIKYKEDLLIEKLEKSSPKKAKSNKQKAKSYKKLEELKEEPKEE